jgi:DNA-binding NarL/FixJ family response regulator
MMLATTVLVADDHPLVREGLSRAVLAHPYLELVAVAVAVAMRRGLLR